MAAPHRFIALEEHCVTPELKAALDGLDSPNLRYTHQFMEDGLIDLADARIAAMDRLGIDVQVLSHRPPGAQFADPATAVFHARRANDAIAAAIDRQRLRARFSAAVVTQPVRSSTSRFLVHTSTSASCTASSARCRSPQTTATARTTRPWSRRKNARIASSSTGPPRRGRRRTSQGPRVRFRRRESWCRYRSATK